MTKQLFEIAQKISFRCSLLNQPYHNIVFAKAGLDEEHTA